jgi:hypothetical protein
MCYKEIKLLWRVCLSTTNPVFDFFTIPLSALKAQKSLNLWISTVSKIPWNERYFFVNFFLNEIHLTS